MKRILLVVFMLTSFTVAMNAQNTEVYQEIQYSTSQNELAQIKKDLQDKGVSLEITKSHRDSKGNLQSISLIVSTSKGTVTYNTSDFKKIVIKSTEADGLSVKAVKEE